MAGFCPWCENADPLFDPSSCFPAAWYTHTHTHICMCTYIHSRCTCACAQCMPYAYVCAPTQAGMDTDTCVHIYWHTHTFLEKGHRQAVPGQRVKEEELRKVKCNLSARGPVHPSCCCLTKGPRLCD